MLAMGATHPYLALLHLLLGALDVQIPQGVWQKAHNHLIKTHAGTFHALSTCMPDSKQLITTNSSCTISTTVHTGTGRGMVSYQQACSRQNTGVKHQNGLLAQHTMLITVSC